MSSTSVSYILLTYNQAETVKAAVDSALRQAGPPLEIVISDDHSTDATFDVITSTVAGYDGPHKVILNRNPENLGLAGNLDTAHRLSSGDVIVAAAGDDMSHPQRCERIREAFDTGRPLLVCSYAKVIDRDGHPVPGDFRTALFYRSLDPARAARSKSLYIGATGAWHRSLYDKYGPIDPDAYEDLVLGFRAALEGRVKVIEEELVQYRLGSGLTSSENYHADMAAFDTRSKKRLVAQMAIMRQRCKDAKLFGLPEHAPILRILHKEQVKAALGLSFYQDETREFRRQILAHPLLGLQTWYSERRRRRKMMRRLEARRPSGHG